MLFSKPLKVLHFSFNKRNSKYDKPFANNCPACVTMSQLTTSHNNVVEWMPNLHEYKDTTLKPNIAFNDTYHFN